MEPGETPQDTVIREVAEETELVVSVNKILGVFGGLDFRYTYPNGHAVEYVVTLFKCQVLHDGGSWSDHETEALRYFAREDIPSWRLLTLSQLCSLLDIPQLSSVPPARGRG